MNKKAQARLSLFFVAVIVVTAASVSVLANVTSVIQDRVARDVVLHQSTDGMYQFDGGYIDDGDYVLVGQIPHDDYSRGGVYFIGSSEMNTAIMTWMLPPAERKLIHNYAIGDLRHSDTRHYVRMLVDDFGLLRAGGEKATVILGLSYQMTRKINEKGGYVEELFHRHRHYSYDPKRGIHRVDQSALERYLRLERDRANRFLRFALLSPSRVVTKFQLYSWRIGHLTGVMRGDWRRALSIEAGELAALIDYLQERKVRVRAILHPSGSWQAEFPYEAAYRDLVLPLLASRNVPVADMSKLLSDNELFDAVHARYSGQVKLHSAYHKLALDALAEMGTVFEP